MRERRRGCKIKREEERVGETGGRRSFKKKQTGLRVKMEED